MYNISTFALELAVKFKLIETDDISFHIHPLFKPILESNIKQHPNPAHALIYAIKSYCEGIGPEEAAIMTLPVLHLTLINNENMFKIIENNPDYKVFKSNYTKNSEDEIKRVIQDVKERQKGR